jgi:hypothetical protein
MPLAYAVLTCCQTSAEILLRTRFPGGCWPFSLVHVQLNIYPVLEENKPN